MNCWGRCNEGWGNHRKKTDFSKHNNNVSADSAPKKTSKSVNNIRYDQNYDTSYGQPNKKWHQNTSESTSTSQRISSERREDNHYGPNSSSQRNDRHRNTSATTSTSEQISCNRRADDHYGPNSSSQQRDSRMDTDSYHNYNSGYNGSKPRYQLYIESRCQTQQQHNNENFDTEVSQMKYIVQIQSLENVVMKKAMKRVKGNLLQLLHQLKNLEVKNQGMSPCNLSQ